MSGYNNPNNRFKFNVKQPHQLNSGVGFQQAQVPLPAVPSFNSKPVYNRSTNQPTVSVAPKQPEEIVIDDDDDDQMFDISDTELIRASQAVESSLIFTNNVHHTTSNALNIFSQFTSNNKPDAATTAGTGLMGPPTQLPPSTLYSNSSVFDPHAQCDDLKLEINKIKTENMQKDGEVKILRDKMKRLEQDMQKMRTERLDLIKKLQQQKDESDRALQKQIEFKEIENQFKTQELVELSMKYKILESTVKKNPTSVQISTAQYHSHHGQFYAQHGNQIAPQSPLHNYQQQQQQPQPHPNGQLFKMSNLPQKRTAPQPTSSDNDENEQPEVKRPTPASRSNAALQNKTNTMSPGASYIKSARSSDQLSNNSSPLTVVKFDAQPHMIHKTSRENIVYKRACILNTKFNARYSHFDSEFKSGDSIYTLTDHFTDMTNYLAQFNTAASSTTLSINNLTKYYVLSDKLKKFIEFIRTFSAVETKPVTAKIEAICSGLNKELVQLLLQHLLLSTTHTANMLALLTVQFVPGSQTTRQRTFRFFVDLVCLVFDAIFKLYLFRIETGESGTSSTQSDETMSKEFFTVVALNMLKFVNFAKWFGDEPPTNGKPKQQVTPSDLSNVGGCFSYLILRVLNSILDCFNVVFSKQSFSQVTKPYGRSSCVYSSLLDNMHGIFNDKYVWYQFKNQENAMDDNREEMIELDMDPKLTKTAAHASNSDDENCLFNIFYQKIQKYFGDIVYSLESNTDSATQHFSHPTHTQPNQDEHVEIITTIASDLTHCQDSKIDFKLNSKNATSNDEVFVNHGMPHSKSQNDLQYEFLQSQVDPSTVTATGAKSDTSIATSVSAASLCDTVQPQLSITPTKFTSNSNDTFNMNMVKYLQNEFTTKFFYFLNNTQLSQAVEDRFFAVHTCTHLISNQLRCHCYKDMLTSLIILVDYQFNEKFIYECGNVKFLDFFRRFASSNLVYLSEKEPDQPQIIDLDTEYLSILTSELLQAKHAEIMHQHEPTSCTYMYISLLLCLNALFPYLSHTSSSCVTRNDPSMNSKKVKIAKFRNELLEQKHKMNEVLLKNDYRIKNLLCIYKLADLNFSEETREYDAFKAEKESDSGGGLSLVAEEEKKATTSKTMHIKSKSLSFRDASRGVNVQLYAHVKSNLASMNSLFRSYVDEYFDYD